MTDQRDAILILGGGVMQLPAIEAAQHMGLVTHVADGNAHCPGASRADVFHHVDLRDVEGLLSCARAIPGLRGAFTAATDFSSSVAWITEHLGLPGIPYEVSLAATDKGRMRDRLSAAGVRIPAYRVVEASDISSGRIDLIVEDLNFPLVCKPVDNMGARGVQRIASPQELAEAVSASLQLSVSKRAILEEMIQGQEYSLDAVVIGDAAHITGVAERHIFFPPWFVELGHTIPAELANGDRRALESTFRDAIRAIGIRNGAAKGDIFLSHDPENNAPVVTVGEIAARLSGGYMSGWTYPAASGVALTQIGIEIALGRTVEPARLQPTRRRVSVERAVISAPGTIRSIAVPERNVPHSILTADDHVFITCHTGQKVAPPTNNVEKVGNIIASGASAEEAERRAAEIRRHITIDLETHNPITNEYVLRNGWKSPWAHYYCSDPHQRSLDERPAIHGPRATLEALVTEGRPLPVQPLGSSHDPLSFGIEPRHIAVDGVESLRRLVENGTIVFRSDSPRADGLFWKAFFAAGLQGVRYLLHWIAMPQEATT